MYSLSNGGMTTCFTARLIVAILAILPGTSALANNIYITNFSSDNVTVLDPATHTPTTGSPFATGAGPSAVAITPDGSRAYVVNLGDNTVTVLDTATHTPIAGSPFATGAGPSAVAITPDGSRAFVVNSAGDMVTVLDTATHTPVAGSPFVTGSAPSAVAITPDGSRAYVVIRGDNTVTVLDTATLTPITGSPFATGSVPTDVAITPDGSRAYVVNSNDDTVTVLDTTTHTPIAGSPFAVGNNPQAVTITSDGSRAYVVNRGDDTITVLDTATLTPITGSPFAVGDTPLAVAITPDGSRAYVVNLSDDTVTVLDTTTHTPIAGSPFATGATPIGVAIVGNYPGQLTFTSASHSGTEGQNVSVTVSRSNGQAGPVSVDYATANGTATEPDDYTAAINSLNWAAGETADKSFTVPLVDDSLHEPGANETIMLSLTNATGGALLGTANASTMDIIDNDAAPIFSVTGKTVNESDGSITVTVTRTGDSAQTSRVDVSDNTSGTASSGADYNSFATQTLLFPQGTNSQNISLTLLDDGVDEPNETVILSLGNPVNATISGTEDRATITITDNDNLPTISIAPVAGIATKAKVGSSNVVMLAADVTVPAYPENLTATSLNLTASGSGQDQVDVTKVTLWLDNGDDVFNANSDTSVTSGIFTTNNGTLTLNGSMTLPAGTTSRIFITYDFNAKLASWALPLFAGSAMLPLLGFVGMNGRRRRVAICLALGTVITLPLLQGCGPVGDAAVAYAIYDATKDDDDQTETFRVTPTSVTAGFPSGTPATTGLPITGPLVTVSE